MVRSRKQPEPPQLVAAEDSSAPMADSDDLASNSSPSQSSEDVTTEGSIVNRPWPPVVSEAPLWPTNLSDAPDPSAKSPVRRLFHWGPLIALSIIAFISAVTTHYVMQWWPLTSAGGLVHFTFFMMWNYMTLSNMVHASFIGGGYISKKWLPPTKEHSSDLQFCKPCNGYKAPRSHHCSKCGRCVMKMDHHCPWINNCVGHLNHAYFVRFLASAIGGCLHAIAIHVICAYHLFHQGWYLRFGDGTDPIIHVTFWSLIALVAASAFSFGVAIGLSGLLFVQLRGIWRNKTGIEEYIDQKAVNRIEEETEEDWLYPYDLGWKRNFKEVLGNLDGSTRGNGIWWPVREPCDQFTLTREQLAQKQSKRRMARLVKITDDFAGGVFGACRHGCKTFFCQPISEEARVKVSRGQHWVITQGVKYWFYGHQQFIEDGPKGWFPRSVAQLLEERPY